MKTQIQKSINHFGLTFLVLLAVFIWGAGCVTPAPTSDPLAGWKVLLSRDSDKLNQAIKDDCWDYIHRLPPEEKNSLTESSIWFFEN